MAKTKAVCFSLPLEDLQTRLDESEYSLLGTYNSWLIIEVEDASFVKIAPFCTFEPERESIDFTLVGSEQRRLLILRCNVVFNGEEHSKEFHNRLRPLTYEPLGMSSDKAANEFLVFVNQEELRSLAESPCVYSVAAYVPIDGSALGAATLTGGMMFGLINLRFINAEAKSKARIDWARFFADIDDGGAPILDEDDIVCEDEIEITIDIMYRCEICFRHRDELEDLRRMCGKVPCKAEEADKDRLEVLLAEKQEWQERTLAVETRILERLKDLPGLKFLEVESVETTCRVSSFSRWSL
jgi:hypothetical protein